MVHQNLAHRPGRDSEEVGPVLPGALRAAELEKGLVDQLGGPHGVVGPLPPERPASHLPQLFVDQGEKAIAGRGVPGAHPLQELGDFVFRGGIGVGHGEKVAHLADLGKAQAPARVPGAICTVASNPRPRWLSYPRADPRPRAGTYTTLI